jgi:hypothetical protein
MKTRTRALTDEWRLGENVWIGNELEVCFNENFVEKDFKLIVLVLV